MILTVFIVLQVIVAVLLALHDWVHIPPLTDIHVLAKAHSVRARLFGSIINTGLVLIPLIATWHYWPGPLPPWALYCAIGSYSLLTIGTIAAWWIPYFFGSSEAHKAGFKEYEHTHAFLPRRGTNITPNTFHVVMHLFIWSCCIISWYLFLIYKRP